MPYRTDDPIADAARYDADRERELKKLPKCSCCRNHIQDDFLYEIGGVLYCERCLNDDFKHDIENYIE